jgi:hypothetical protein
MQRKCETCGFDYDDARCTTICPHQQFISDENAKQKDLAFSLVGKPLRWLVELPGYAYVPIFIQSIRHDGMVTLRGDEFPGEFAPHLFTVIEVAKP